MMHYSEKSTPWAKLWTKRLNQDKQNGQNPESQSRKETQTVQTGQQQRLAQSQRILTPPTETGKPARKRVLGAEGDADKWQTSSANTENFGELAQQIENPNTEGGLEKLQTLINTMSKTEVAKAVKVERSSHYQTPYANTAPIIKAPKLESNKPVEMKNLPRSSTILQRCFSQPNHRK